MQRFYSHPEVHAPPRVRSNLRAINEFLCINIITVNNQSFWYILARGNHSSTPASLITLPQTPILTVDSACAIFGPNIYVLGGFRNGYPTNTVQIYDAHLGTWEQFYRLRVPRRFASAGMIGSTMYVVGGTPSLAWSAEAFYPMARQWFPVPRTSIIRRRTIAHNNGGSFLVTDNGGLMFVGHDGFPWNRYYWSLVKKWVGKMTVLDGVFYICHRGGYITGYVQATNYGFIVHGLDFGELLPNLWERSRLTNLRGMLCIVWKDNQMINWIGIQITRTIDEMVWGSIAWRERVPLPTDAVKGELDYCGKLEY